MNQPIKTMAEFAAEGKMPEVLFWVGCAGSFDERAKKITKAFALLLQKAGVEFAILGQEENCTGDPAKRAGNEFLFQMQAMMNIETLNNYGVKTIVTACPHCFNTLKNEYPQLGGNYEVLHHTQFLHKLLNEGRLKVEGGKFKGKKIVFHDPCYLGRANGEYEAPRAILAKLEADLAEMKRCRQNGFCCGAGGAQMFKEPEKGTKDINIERTEEAIENQPNIIATSCPFCNTMFIDGVKIKEKEKEILVKDIAELLNEEI
ncbi:MAG: (Fe-S)-binding protein [Flavobacteriaceae bacterium]|jgi:Fe-S oxidoreductase|nr:(Fe-S)-binding protein [Flavobacteriaceae bacterium]